MDAVSLDNPALAVLEVASIARGVVVADALIKRARVRILRADPITPGKYLLVFVGLVAEVEESLAAAREAAGDREIDALFLPYVHQAVAAGIERVTPRAAEGAAVGVLELATVAATVLAADAALKAADVELAALHLARGIGGKGYVLFTGALESVEAALEAGDAAVSPEHRVGRELLPRPHGDLDWVLGRL